MKLKFKKTNKDCILPSKGTSGSNGYDLYSLEDGIINTKTVSVFKTGLAIGLPQGYAAIIWPRSGLAFKETVSVMGGLIDSDYNLEIKVGLIKKNDDTFTFVKKGDRIAQMFIIKTEDIEWEEVNDFAKTERVGGMGSTGGIAALMAD